MELGGPMFDPGDYKVISQGFPPASSRAANRTYFVLALGLALLGVGAFVRGEYLAGAILTVIGLGAAVVFARAELGERLMVKSECGGGPSGTGLNRGVFD